MENAVKTINVAKDFSRYPAGRYYADGPFSGEAFRNEKLIPALTASESVVVELDGTAGYGSSFLEEAFGGLRRKGFASTALRQKLKLNSQDGSLLAEIEDYLYANT